MNKLKAFVRYDGSGCMVSGSLILRQFKPRVGNWEEILANECCNPSPSPVNSLRLVLDDIINTIYLVNDASSVEDWNSYFDLPNYGSPFTSVIVEGNNVTLIGGSNIETRFGLFSNYGHLIEVDDTGLIITLGDETFAINTEGSVSILQRVSFPAVTRTIYETPETGDNYGCFGGCYVLEYANLPLLVNMEGCEFYCCYLLNNLIIPYSEITSLGWYAFSNCTSLTSINLPSLTTAGESCFSNCPSLTTVNLPSLTTAGEECFYYCTSLTTVNFPSLTTAGEDCFSNCASLTSVNLPSLTTVGDSCFYNCDSLTTVDLPLLITSGEDCFSDCTSLTSVNLPVLTTASGQCFSWCTNLTTINLPSLTTAGQYCFGGCTSLTLIDLPLCINLGETIGDDDVFYEIIGNDIILNVPIALMTCNEGQPDGDIQYLVANNTVTIFNQLYLPK